MCFCFGLKASDLRGKYYAALRPQKLNLSYLKNWLTDTIFHVTKLFVSADGVFVSKFFMFVR